MLARGFEKHVAPLVPYDAAAVIGAVLGRLASGETRGSDKAAQ
jgi:hypothetical protein